jgi:ribosomal protein S18 acetylase RimI-like enzyme
VQGLDQEGWGAIQNLGVSREHRGLGLGSLLVHQALVGFRSIGLKRMHLEVTSDNTAAIRLYTRLGFCRAKTVFKAAEVAGA